MIEKEELRGRINKILRDEIGRELLDMTADKIIDAVFADESQELQEPRVGQICEFWDGLAAPPGRFSILTGIERTHQRQYINQ